MREFTYLIKDFEDQYNTPNGFFDNTSAIVDNELMNDISDDWDYEKGKIMVTGILYKGQIHIFLKEKEGEEFKSVVCKKLLDLGTKTPLYAFNKNFEIGNFKGDFGCEIEIKEIKPFNARGWSKDKFYNELRSRLVIPDIRIKDALKGNAKDCPKRWEQYKKTGDIQNLIDVVSHNLSCLLKESVILKHKDFFLNNWELDKRGFMLRELRG